MTREQHEFKPENVTENEIYKFMISQWQHQNQMGWSRLYFVLALEIAILSGAFFFAKEWIGKGWIGIGIGIALICIGTLVGFIIYRLMHRDLDIRDQHLEILDKVHMPLDIRMTPKVTTTLNNFLHNSQFLLRSLFFLLLIINLTAIVLLIHL